LAKHKQKFCSESKYGGDLDRLYENELRNRIPAKNSTAGNIQSI
jgi:hypothetical protein